MVQLGSHAYTTVDCLEASIQETIDSVQFIHPFTAGNDHSWQKQLGVEIETVLNLHQALYHPETINDLCPRMADHVFAKYCGESVTALIDHGSSAVLCIVNEEELLFLAQCTGKNSFEQILANNQEAGRRKLIRLTRQLFAKKIIGFVKNSIITVSL